jgi:hypothetical protein
MREILLRFFNCDMSHEADDAVQIRVSAKRNNPAVRKKHTSLGLSCNSHLSENFRAEVMGMKTSQQLFQAEKSRSKDGLTFGVELSILIERERSLREKQPDPQTTTDTQTTKFHNIPHLVQVCVNYLQQHGSF